MPPLFPPCLPMLTQPCVLGCRRSEMQSGVGNANGGSPPGWFVPLSCMLCCAVLGAHTFTLDTDPRIAGSANSGSTNWGLQRHVSLCRNRLPQLSLHRNTACHISASPGHPGQHVPHHIPASNTHPVPQAACRKLPAVVLSAELHTSHTRTAARQSLKPKSSHTRRPHACNTPCHQPHTRTSC